MRRGSGRCRRPARPGSAEVGPAAISRIGRDEPLTRPGGLLVYGCWCDALAAETTETKDEWFDGTQVAECHKESRKSDQVVL